MENIKLWRAAIVVRKLFMEECITNDFDYLMNEKNPNLSVIPLADAILAEKAIYQKTALGIVKAYPSALASFSNDLESNGRSKTVSVSVFDDVSFSPQGLRDYLDSHHILDNLDEETNPLYVYALDLKLEKNGDPEERYDLGCTEWAKDVVLSSRVDYVLSHMQQAIELQCSAMANDFKFGGSVESIEIRRGRTALFEVPVRDGRPDLDRINIVEADLRDIMSLGVILAPEQIRRARGQLVTNELGI